MTSSHYDVILIVLSFATELATPSVTEVRTDTLPRLIYKYDRVGISDAADLSPRQINPHARLCRCNDCRIEKPGNMDEGKPQRKEGSITSCLRCSLPLWYSVPDD